MSKFIAIVVLSLVIFGGIASAKAATINIANSNANANANNNVINIGSGSASGTASATAKATAIAGDNKVTSSKQITTSNANANANANSNVVNVPTSKSGKLPNTGMEVALPLLVSGIGAAVYAYRQRAKSFTHLLGF